MKCTEVIEVDEELSNFVDAANYEVNSRLDVISYMLANNMTTTTDAFRSYQAELIEYKKKYDLAKAELEKQVVTPFLDAHNIPKANWNLDFATHKITIDWEQEGAYGNGWNNCSCGDCKCDSASCNEA